MDFELKRWTEDLRGPFAQMQLDPVVMADLGGPFSEAASDEKFDRYRSAWGVDGISRWAIVSSSGEFLGYCGVMRRSDTSHPLGSHLEIGWRLCRAAWGHGIATTSARQALAHAWAVVEEPMIFSYTAPDNGRSRQVMARLGLRRDRSRDFTADYPRGRWEGLVWIADRK